MDIPAGLGMSVGEERMAVALPGDTKLLVGTSQSVQFMNSQGGKHLAWIISTKTYFYPTVYRLH